MSIKSILTPTASVGTALATGGLVIAVHQKMLPDNGVMQATEAYDANLESSRKQAAWTSVAVVTAVSLLTKDVNVLVIGGLTAFALDMYSRYCIVKHPATGQIVTSTPQTPTLTAVAN